MRLCQKQQETRPFSRGKDLSRFGKSFQSQEEAETKVVLNDKLRDKEMSLSGKEEPKNLSGINAAPNKVIKFKKLMNKIETLDRFDLSLPF